MATKIMIIRHGEKPSDDASIHGVDQNGQHDPTELIVRGWQRAGALVRLFAPPNGAFSNHALATPQAIFACGPNNHAKTVRPLHTVQTLEQFVTRNIDQCVEKRDEKNVVSAAISPKEPVLIAWEHDAIPDIVATTGRGSPVVIKTSAASRI